MELQGTQLQNNPITIHGLFSDGTRKDFSISTGTTANDFIKMITVDPDVHKPENRVIALIHQGKLLDSNAILSSIENSKELTLNIFYRLPHITEQEPIVELRGFDRLQNMNYSPEQIAEIRNNFHSMNNTLNSPHDAQIDLEEEWFPTIFNQENPLDLLNMNIRPTPRHHHRHPPQNASPDINFQGEQPPWIDFLIGLVLGIILGPFSLLFMVMAVHDKVMIVGLFMGALIHLIYRYVF